MRLRRRSTTFRVLSVGVNSDLQFAQKDARDIARAMSGAAGIVGPEDVTYLAEVSVDELRAALYQLSLEQPTFLVFFFAGHGTPTGIVLSDDEMTFIELAAWLRQIGAHATLTILDSCHSGGYMAVGGIAGRQTTLGAIEDDAREVLMQAVPGNRIICSVAADRTAGEGGGVPNGHLTSALLAAMNRAHGDLEGRFGTMLSERRLFNAAKIFMRRRGRQMPVARRLRGDFPVMRSHDHVFGEAALRGAGVVDGTFQATLAFVARRGLPTPIVVEARNVAGEVIKRFCNVVFATKDVDHGTFLYPLSTDDLYGDGLSATSISLRGRAPVRWSLSILDARGRVLARAHHLAVHADPISPYVHGGW